MLGVVGSCWRVILAGEQGWYAEISVVQDAEAERADAGWNQPHAAH